MRKVCLQCKGTFDTQFLCPKCGVQLLEVSPHSSALLAGRGVGEDDARPAGMATRFIAGCLLALGTFYGMSLIGSGFFLVIGVHDGWSSVIGRFMQPGLLMFAAILGGMLAGAGNPRGLAAGAAVGLFHALTVVGAMFVGGAPPHGMMLYTGWILLPVMGAIGGRYGRFVWPPLSDVFNPPPIEAPVEAKKGKKKKKPATPTAWFRVIGGAALGIGCTVWAGRIREYIIGTSGGTFVVDSRIQVQFVTWVIAALAIVIGAVFAGASTRAGIRHGLLVGILTCVGIFVIYSQVIGEALPAERFFAKVVGLPEEDENTPARIGLFLITNALILSTIGGWLGATLFPRTSAVQKLDRGAI